VLHAEAVLSKKVQYNFLNYGNRRLAVSAVLKKIIGSWLLYLPSILNRLILICAAPDQCAVYLEN
jgi:hypothetical protein